MPDHTPIIIVNTTPIISLALIGKLDLLHLLYGTVLTPPAVQAEVLAGSVKNIGVLELQQSNWIRVTPLQDPKRADLISDLDRGEAEVIHWHWN